MASNVLGACGTLETAQGKVTICRLQALEKAGIVSRLDRLPFSIKILLEGVLHSVDGERHVSSPASFSWKLLLIT